MDSIKFDGTGADSAVLARSSVFISAVVNTEIYKSALWHAEKLGSESDLRKDHDWYQETFQGGLTGHHGHIANRRTARDTVVSRYQKIARYMSLMADERDIEAMVNAGAVTRKSTKKARKATKPA